MSQRTRAERDAWPGWCAALISIVLIVVMVGIATWRDGGFAYPLDDAYIHLRLGENLRHGTLGMNPGEFASAGSSPIWPVLIAGAVFAVGPLVGVPLVLASIVTVVTLLGVDRWGRDHALTLNGRLVLLGGFLFAVPLPVVALTGMEHVLQIGSFFLLSALVISRFDAPELLAPASGRHRRRQTWFVREDILVGLAAGLAAATRFEVLFLLVPLGLMLVVARRVATVVWMGLGSIIPVAVTAVVNVGQGWPALPASVLAKSMSSGEGLAGRLLPLAPDHLLVQRRLVPLGLLIVTLWIVGVRRRGRTWPASATRWSVLSLSAITLHTLYVPVPGIFRYDAYLVALGIGACALNAHAILAGQRISTLGHPRLVRVWAIALGVTVLISGVRMYPMESVAMSEIHDQQLQMARFSAEACPGCPVVVNDIGAVAMYGEGRVLDDFGLASQEALEAKRNGRWTSERLDELARQNGAVLAMVYDTPYWIPGVPARWQPIGTWTIQTQQVVAGRTVSFFSLDVTRTEGLRDAFATFDTPDGVTVETSPVD